MDVYFSFLGQGRMDKPSEGPHLVYVRLAHNGRLLCTVLFLFFLIVIFLVTRISGRHRVAHDHERTLVHQPGGKILGGV